MNAEKSKHKILAELHAYYIGKGVQVSWINQNLLIDGVGWYWIESVNWPLNQCYVCFKYINSGKSISIFANTYDKLIHKLSQFAPDLLYLNRRYRPRTAK